MWAPLLLSVYDNSNEDGEQREHQIKPKLIIKN